MPLKNAISKAFHSIRVSVVALTVFQFSLGGGFAAPAQAGHDDGDTTTPIKHVIVLIGENRSTTCLGLTCPGAEKRCATFCPRESCSHTYTDHVSILKFIERNSGRRSDRK